MSLVFRLLLLLPLLHLFVILTPLKLKAQVGPVAATSQELPSVEEETHDGCEIELHVPTFSILPARATVHPITFDPPALESVTLDRERPKPRT